MEIRRLVEPARDDAPTSYPPSLSVSLLLLFPLAGLHPLVLLFVSSLSLKPHFAPGEN